MVHIRRFRTTEKHFHSAASRCAGSIARYGLRAVASVGVDLTSRASSSFACQAGSSTLTGATPPVGVVNSTDRGISTQVNAIVALHALRVLLATGFAAVPRHQRSGDMLNGRFNTGSIRHDVAIGSAGYVVQLLPDVTTSAAGLACPGSERRLESSSSSGLPACRHPGRMQPERLPRSVVHQQARQRGGHGDARWRALVVAD